MEVLKLKTEKLKGKKHKISLSSLSENREKTLFSLFPCSEIRKEKNMIYVIFFRGKIGKKKTLIYKEIFSSLLAQVTGGSSRA